MLQTNRMQMHGYKYKMQQIAREIQVDKYNILRIACEMHMDKYMQSMSISKH